MSSWFRRIRDYDTTVADLNATRSALAASRAQRGQEAAARIEYVTGLEADVRRLNRERDELLEYSRRVDLELARVSQERADAVKANSRLKSELTEAHEQLMRADQYNAQVSGQLADAREQLASYTLAETIADETRAKRYHDGQGDQ